MVYLDVVIINYEVLERVEGLKKFVCSIIILSFTLFGCSEVQTEGYVLEVEENRILVAERISKEKYEKIKGISASEINDEKVSLTYFTYEQAKEINVGSRVKVWFDGNVVTSYPAKAGATKIVILE